MNTIKLSTAQALVKFLDNVYLENNGVETKFITHFGTIFGHGNVLGLGEALAYLKLNFQFYQAKNEQAMGHVALGFCKAHLRFKIMACTSSIGPGSTNMITAAATATANHLPLLLFPSDTFVSTRPDPVLQQLEFDHNLVFSTNDAFKAVCKYFDRIYHPEQLIKSILWAIEVLINPQTTGAVCLCMPQDVMSWEYDFPKWFFKKRIYKIEPFISSNIDFNKVQELLTKAKQPLIIIGGGARYSNAKDAIKTFSSMFKIPLAYTQAGKSTVESSYEYHLGGIGVTGNLAANMYAKNADLIIGIGTKYSDFTTGSKELFNINVQFINVNIKKFDLQKMLGFGLWGDAKIVLEQLINFFKKNQFQKTYDQALINFNLAKKAWKKELINLNNLSLKTFLKKPLVNDQNAFLITDFKKQVKTFYQKEVEIFIQAKLVYKINSILNNHLITTAAGSLPGDLHRLWETDYCNSYMAEYGYSCMGHEIAAAIGSSIAHNKEVSYAFVGDGSFLMLHSEIHTAVQEQIPVVILLFDNAGFGCINNLQADYYIKNFETHFHYRNSILNKKLKLMITDYTKIAQGYGLDAYLVHNEKELETLLKKSKTTKKPMLIEMKVYPKSMTHGYESNWMCGISNLSIDPKVAKKAVIVNKLFSAYNKKFN